MQLKAEQWTLEGFILDLEELADVKELFWASKWDGHTPEEAIWRIMHLNDGRKQP